MEQKKLVITVYNENGEVVFSKDPAIPQNVPAVLSLFDEIGYEICVAVRKYEPVTESKN